MSRAIWSGPISFGLVNIPITLHPATRSKSVSFRLLHAEDNTPVNFVKTCPADNKALGQEEIVKGYEFEKGRFVVMEDKDFQAVEVKKGRAIEVLNFVSLKDVDPIYFQKSYYLAPEAGSIKAFKLFHEAMKRQDKAALARFSLRNKQQMALVRPYDGVLVLETLFYYDEVDSIGELAPPGEESELNPDEMELAEGLIERMTSDFDLSRHHDEYREELLAVIDRKIEGKEITVPKVEPLAPVVDIMDALRESIARQERGEPRRRKKAS
ncbi:MAG: Ku protein [Thermoleophilia bacterium]|nr:Ku protein [Thermoleophilia bacterium]